MLHGSIFSLLTSRPLAERGKQRRVFHFKRFNLRCQREIFTDGHISDLGEECLRCWQSRSRHLGEEAKDCGQVARQVEERSRM